MRRVCHRPRGYVAIVSAIVLAALFISLTLTVSNHAFITRFNQLRHENKVRSSILAHSCIFIALGEFANNAEYSPHDVSIALSATDSCTVDSLKVATNTATLEVHSGFGASNTHLNASIRLSPDGTFGLPVITRGTSMPP